MKLKKVRLPSDLNITFKCDTYMCIYMCMYTQSHMYTHNGILFNLKKEGNPAICDNDSMDEHGEHYDK